MDFNALVKSKKQNFHHYRHLGKDSEIEKLEVFARPGIYLKSHGDYLNIGGYEFKDVASGCGKEETTEENHYIPGAVGRDSSVHDDPSKAVCDSCCQGNENPNHRCTKCNKPFKYVEKEKNNPNSNFACHECKKQIKAGEKYYSQTIPDAFQPQTVYYCEPCGEKKKNEGTPLPGSGK
ncbi:885_t:CDS:2 [Entrophospora sp. SA101]|nr:885_t:CDS:2 [Entrophospora sp. SA101]